MGNPSLHFRIRRDERDVEHGDDGMRRGHLRCSLEIRTAPREQLDLAIFERVTEHSERRGIELDGQSDRLPAEERKVDDHPVRVRDRALQALDRLDTGFAG
jgi:hypothetical protein